MFYNQYYAIRYITPFVGTEGKFHVELIVEYDVEDDDYIDIPNGVMW